MHTAHLACTGYSKAPWLRNSFFSTDLVTSMSGQTIQVEKKNLENFLSVHARMHLACTGNISSGPQSIILKIAWNDLSICILTGLGSTFWVTEKFGQKWFHGSVAPIKTALKVALNGLWNGQFSLDPSYRRGRVYKRKFYLYVCTYVITSTFPILGLQIIPESCWAYNIIHHWIED